MSNIINRIQGTKVIADLATEPVSLDDIQTYGLITFADYDLLLTAFEKSARMQLENYTGKSFGVKTIECSFGFNGKKTGIKLDAGPVDTENITEILYRVCACPGVEFSDVTADTSFQYEIRNDRFYGPEGEYVITYQTKWDNLPEDLLTAIKAQTMSLFENKDDASKQGTICPTARSLAFPYVDGENLL